MISHASHASVWCLVGDSSMCWDTALDKAFENVFCILAILRFQTKNRFCESSQRLIQPRLVRCSHTLLQRREKDGGRVTRVPAIQLEKLVVEAIRAKAQPVAEPTEDLSDRAVIDRYVTRIIVRPDSIDIELREPTLAPQPLP